MAWVGSELRDRPVPAPCPGWGYQPLRSGTTLSSGEGTLKPEGISSLSVSFSEKQVFGGKVFSVVALLVCAESLAEQHADAGKASKARETK